ncbi:MAG: hypothetical protein ACI9NT_002294 [Bacteroidia bacterium]|jgi:hypothetical protein
MNPSDFDKLELSGDWLCDVELIAAPNSPGTIDSPWGATSVGYIESGEFQGPVLNGRVLPGGGDWPSVSVDGQNNFQVNVRAVWETNDGAQLYVQYYGFIVVPKELLGPTEALAALDPSEYYFRTAPTFRTGDERYAWLNTVLCVGIGRFTEKGLGYRIFRVG